MNILSADEQIGKLNATTLNTILIFTAHDGLSSGLYHFTKTANAIDMHIYHLPFRYQFHSEGNLNYFIIGNVGYSRISLTGNPQKYKQNSILSYNNHVQAYMGGLGGGVRYKITKDFLISTGLQFIYSRVGISIDKKDGINGAIVDFFNDNHSNNLSMEFSTLFEYKPIVHGMKPYVTLAYKHFQTKSKFSLKALTQFNSSSSIATMTAGIESVPFWNEDNNYCSVEGYAGTNYLWGNVKDIVNFQNYSTLGGIFYYNTPKKPWWASRFFVELSGVKGNGLEGYNAGIGFSLAY